MSGSRLRRFMGKDERTQWLKACVHRFREPIGYPLPDTVPEPQPFSDKLRALQATNMNFAPTPAEQQAIDRIIERVEQVRAVVKQGSRSSLNPFHLFFSGLCPARGAR